MQLNRRLPPYVQESRDINQTQTLMHIRRNCIRRRRDQLAPIGACEIALVYIVRQQRLVYSFPLTWVEVPCPLRFSSVLGAILSDHESIFSP